ncbi:MAG TPA: phosphatidylinositol mannoside acyltransferase [Mycobacteriales bacterium]|nr:phosphatidylinositol mannoside acyltransferase [Mycobacteriales bacterium]
MRERWVDAGFAAGWAAVRALPEPVAAAGFAAGGTLAAHRDTPGVRRLRANLARVTDADVVGRAMRSYARYWRETFRLSRITPAYVRDHTEMTGLDVLDKALDSGRGTILALPHCGNWDAAGVWLLQHGAPFSTVAERLKPESLYERFVAYREGLGMEVLPLTGGPRPPSDVLKERLKAGRTICLLGDRDLTRRGVDVEFFGDTARMPAGPALLAATTGAALHPVGLWFTRGGWGIRVHPEVPVGPGRLRDTVAAATQQLADAFAADIALRPYDWHMLQRLWLSDPAR